MKKVSLFILFAVFVFSSCRNDKINPDDDVPSYVPTPYHLNIPNGFPTPNVADDNILTYEGIELGKLLYYDSILHPLHKRACASCHFQEQSFASATVNSMAHINLAFNSTYLSTGKIEGTLEDVMLFEVEDFFGTDLSKLNAHAEYPELFRKAMNITEIKSKDVAYALAQFETTMISANSKWDRYLKGQASLTSAEAQGYEIFFTEKGDCFHCHGTALFSDNLYHNNGLDANPDDGRFAITGNPDDIGKFRSTTLRNIDLTAPYMHDGRFQTLEEVVDFYSDGLQFSPTIDPLMKNVGQGGVNLSPADKSFLVAFLKTFTDTSYVNNPNLSSPY